MKSKSLPLRILLVITAIIYSFTSHAKSPSIHSITDSLVPALMGDKQKISIKLSADSIFAEANDGYAEAKFTAELSNIEDDYSRTGNNKKLFFD